MGKPRDPTTLKALMARFGDEAECHAFLQRARWPHGPVCPRCGSVDRASRITTRRGAFTCLDCGRRFSVTAGTAMHRTHLPLSVWIAAMFLMATSSKGVSALKMSEWLGIQYRTTWHLAHRVRRMMESEPELMRGVVELDKTFVGGDPRPENVARDDATPLFDDPNDPPATGGSAKPAKPKRRSRGGGKPMAFTAVERGGKARMALAASHSTLALGRLVKAWVDPAAVISPDELPAYRMIGRGQAGHLRVNHSAGEYARDDARTRLRAHCNTAESVHVSFKRALVGVFHRVSVKHMDRQLTEVTHRWNSREATALARMAGLFGGGSRPLPFKALVA